MDSSKRNLTQLKFFPIEHRYLTAVFLFISFIISGGTAALAQSYYVSGTSGNDSWSGTLAAPNTANTDGPFKTLTRAQSAMQASTIKMATIRGGTYSIASTNLAFDWRDTGETWIPYQNETVVIDGSGSGYVDGHGADNLSFMGLTFQNLGSGTGGGGLHLNGSGHIIRWNKFLNCNSACFSGSGFYNSLIDSNAIDGQSPGNPVGGGAYSAINLWYGSSNNRVSHNLIENTQGGGIAFGAGATDPAINNNIIDRNILRNVNTKAVDNGAIYMMDRTHTAVGNQITNNVIDGNGGVNFLTNWTKAIYLDDLMSNTLVSGNICRNCGQYAVQYHGGDHNIIVNNIFDLSGGALLGLYQDLLQYGNYGMTGNVCKNNIVYFSSTAPNSLWRWSQDPNDTLMTKPTDTTNLYYSATGTSIPNSGHIIDANPVYANPQFTNPSAADYSMPPTSPAYTQIQFQPLPTDQGPLPYPNISPPTNVRVLQVSP